MRASASTSAASAISPSPSRSHCTAAPVTKIEASERVGQRGSRSATRPSLSRPGARRGRATARVHEHERTGAVRVLAHPRVRRTPGRTARPAGRRRRPRSGAAWPPSASGASAERPGGGPRPRAAPRNGTPNSSQQLRVPAPRGDVEQHRARGVRDVGHVHAPAVSLNSSHESTVPNNARPASARSRSPSTWSSSHSIFVAEK